MSLTDMYPAKNNSPVTTLTAGINSADTSMTVEDASVLPAAPNIAVIGTTDSAEIVKYTAINSNTLTIVRGQNGTVPGVWAEGTTVARNFTAMDHEAFRENILDLEQRKTNTGHTHDDRYYTESEIDTALAGKQNNLTFDTTPTAGSANPVTSGGIKTALDTKQDTLTFDSTPTANSTNPVTSGGIKTYVDSHDDFKITGTVSSSGYTLTDSRINDEHWEVDWIQFTTSSNVMTAVNWSTDIVNNTVTLSATYSGSTNIIVNMHWVQ